MSTSSLSDATACSSAATMTANARVVAVEPGRVWLEPLQTGSCGACASAALCGDKGIGTLASRLEQRRFAVAAPPGLRVGDTVEVAVAERTLVKAAAIAYAVPLVGGLGAALVVQAQTASDGLTLLATLLGMAAGFAVTRRLAARLEARGALRAHLAGPAAPQPIHFHTGEQRDA